MLRTSVFGLNIYGLLSIMEGHSAGKVAEKEINMGLSKIN
jgi:hypothetical protein